MGVAPLAAVKIRIEPGDVIVEMLSIVVAILLALAVNNWQEHLRQQRDLRTNVVNIVRELEYNQRALSALLPQHEREAAGFHKETSADLGRHEQLSLDDFFHVFRGVAPRGLGVIQLQQDAWQIAQGDPSFAAMPAEQRLALARVYSKQAFLNEIYARLIDHVPSTSAPTYFPALLALSLDFSDATITEHELLRAYAEVLSQLRTAYAIPGS
jgi:hypothetical protein